MPRWTALVLAALLGPVLALPAAAQWKWLDKKRVVQYSDLPPPPDTAEQDILQRPNQQPRALPAAAPQAAAASGPPPLMPKMIEPELDAKQRKAEQDEAAKKKAEEAKVAAARAENCSRARTQMRTLDTGVRIARANDKGEREILDDAARAEEVKRTRDVIASDCK